MVVHSSSNICPGSGQNGSCLVTLNTFLAASTAVLVARPQVMNSDRASKEAALHQAVDNIGYVRYDFSLSNLNGALTCSPYVWQIFKNALNVEIGPRIRVKDYHFGPTANAWVSANALNYVSCINGNNTQIAIPVMLYQYPQTLIFADHPVPAWPGGNPNPSPSAHACPGTF